MQLPAHAKLRTGRPAGPSCYIGLDMRTALTVPLLASVLLCTDSRADVENLPVRTMPHQNECATPLPPDFWGDPAAEPFKGAEAWAWNERICLGRSADMRNAPGGSGNQEMCQPAEIEKRGEAVPTRRELRPQFLELVLSHEPWASAPRHPQVVIGCAMVRGDIDLGDHEIAPTFGLHQSKVDGKVTLLGTKFRRSLSLMDSTVTGKLNAGRLQVGSGLFLRGGTFTDIDLIGARIARNLELSGATVTGKLDADESEVERSLHLRGGTFADIDLLGARIAGDADLTGSTVTGSLNANRLDVGSAMYLHDGGTFADISLVGARIGGDTVFHGSKVAGNLVADQLEVGRSLFLRDGMFAEIRFPGARVAGDVNLIGSTVTARLNAGRLDVGSGLFLRGGTFTDIDLLGARIAGDADLAGSTVTGKLVADGFEVGGSLRLHGGMFANIDLLGAKIVGDADLSGSAVAGSLAADGLEIGGSLFLRAGGKYAGIRLLGSKAGGIVELSGSTFSGEVNLTGATLDGELHLSSGRVGPSPTWKRGSSLILRNTKADVLQARRDSWNMSAGGGLLPTDLTGFMFNRFGGLDASGGAGMGDESADWLISWIEAQRDHGDFYDPQPYAQLAQVLEVAGATHRAKAVHYAKFEHARDYDKSMSTLRRTRLGFERILVGYGIYPFRVLYWFAGLVVFGMAGWTVQQ